MEPSRLEKYLAGEPVEQNERLLKYLDKPQYISQPLFDTKDTEGLTPEYLKYSSLDNYRADKQTTSEELTNAASKFLPQVGLMVLESAGNIADLENWGGAMGLADTNFQNWLSTWAKDKQTEVNAEFPIYRKDNTKAFDPADSAWWIENGSSLFESVGAFGALGFGIGGAFGKVAGSLFAAAPRLANAISASSQVVSTLALTHAEGVMGGADVYKRVIQDKMEKAQGLPKGSLNLTNEEIAQMPVDPEAAEAAATATRLNYFNFALNYTSLSPIFKKAKYSRSIDDIKEFNVLKKGANETLEAFTERTAKYKPTSLMGTAGKLASESTQEALEEGVNVWAQNKGLAQAGVITEEEAELIPSLFSKEGLLSMALGAVGGAAMTGGIQAVTGRENAKQAEEQYQTRRSQIIANYGEKGTALVKSMSAISQFTTLLKQAEQEGNVEEAKSLKRQLIDNIAVSNFISGTTSSLYSMLEEEQKKSKEQLISEEKLSEDASDMDYDDYKQDIRFAVNHTKEQEKLYNKAKSLGEGISPSYTFDLYTLKSQEKELLNLSRELRADESFNQNKLQEKLLALNIDYTIDNNGNIEVPSNKENLLNSMEEYRNLKDTHFNQDEVSKSLEANQKNLDLVMSTEYRKKIQKAYKEDSKKELKSQLEKKKKEKQTSKQANKKQTGTPTPPPAPVPQPSSPIETNLTVPIPIPEPTLTTPIPSEDISEIPLTTPPPVNTALDGEISAFFAMMEDEDLEVIFDNEPSANPQFDKSKMLFDFFIERIFPQLQKQDINTPEAAVNYISNVMGKDMTAKHFDRYIKPIFTMVYGVSEFTNKTFDDIYIDPVLNGQNLNFNIEDYMNGEFYGLTPTQFKKIEKELRDAIAMSLSTDSTGSIRDTLGKLIYLNERLIAADNKFGYSSREYIEELKGLTFNIEDASDTLDPSQNYDKNILSNNQYNPGTKIILEVVSEKDFVPYKDKEGNLVTYKQLLDKGIGFVPIIIKNEKGETVAYVHTIDYINPTRVVEVIDGVDNLKENRKNLMALREIVVNKNRVSATITSKTLGFLFTTKDQEKASQRLIAPKLAMALSSNSLSSGSKGVISSDISDNILNKQNSFIPGVVYYLAETQGKYLAVPLYRVNMENESEIKSDLTKIITAFFKADRSIADPTEFDAQNSTQVQEFLEQYLFLKHNLEKNYESIAVGKQNRNYVDFDAKSGTLIWSKDGGVLRKMYRTPDGKIKLTTTTLSQAGRLSTTVELNDVTFNTTVNGLINTISQSQINISAKKLGMGTFTFRKFEGNKLVSKKMSYRDFILEHLTTNVKDHKLPDGSVTAFHQKTVGFEINEKEVVTPVVKPKVKVVTDAKADIERKKSLSQELISFVWERLAKKGITNADSVIGTRETIDGVDFDKFWSNVTKEDLQNLRKLYETKKLEQLDLYNKFKGEFDPSTGTITSNDTSFFDNKIKNVDAELTALESKPETVETPVVPKTPRKSKLGFTVKSNKETDAEPDIISIKPGVEELFDSNPELASIGTQEQYSQYLDTIFPNSQVKDIVYHGSPNAKLVKNSTDFNFRVNSDDVGITNGVYFSETIALPTSFQEGIYKGTNTTNKGIITALVNLKNPKYYRNLDDISVISDKELQKLTSDKFDGAYTDMLADDNLRPIKQTYNTEIVIFEPEQIHILGSKQDIEGFKKFNQKSLKTVNYEEVLDRIKKCITL
jgi:hypothetical protein